MTKSRAKAVATRRCNRRIMFERLALASIWLGAWWRSEIGEMSLAHSRAVARRRRARAA